MNAVELLIAEHGLIREYLESLAEYTALLRQNIHLEDHVFYPRIVKELPSSEMEDLRREFERRGRSRP